MRDNTLINDLQLSGYVVFENFLFRQECDELLECAMNFTENLPPPEERFIFSSKDENEAEHLKTQYFMESNDKIRCFFEKEALDEKGELKVEPIRALSKVGHALHLLNKVFRCYTYCERVKSICRKLGFKEPAVVQSMLIYKNPGIGGEVKPHQDITYLKTEPVPPIGFWIALEDATKQNGCLWVAPGSHRSGIHRNLIRNPDPNGTPLIYDKPEPNYSKSSFIPLEMKKGSCVVLHGGLVHMSMQNMSEKGRPAYTFHIIEKFMNNYSPNNWLQEGKNAPFLNMYETRSYVWEKSGDLLTKNEEDAKEQAEDQTAEEDAPL